MRLLTLPERRRGLVDALAELERGRKGVTWLFLAVCVAFGLWRFLSGPHRDLDIGLGVLVGVGFAVFQQLLSIEAQLVRGEINRVDDQLLREPEDADDW